MESSVGPQEAAAALDLVASSRSALADRMVTPWWYHPALGVFAALPIASPAAHSYVVYYAAIAVLLAGCGVLARAYRKLTGVWVSGNKAGRASRWAYVLGAVFVVAGGLSALASLAYDAWAISLVIAVAQIPVTVLVGRRFDDAYRRQLREQG